MITYKIDGRILQLDGKKVYYKGTHVGNLHNTIKEILVACDLVDRMNRKG